MKQLKIKSVTKLEGIHKVYDISVDKTHNYILENGVVTHNSGLKYAASSIVMLAKSKDKEGKAVIGAIIRAKNYKSRVAKENAEVEMNLSYRTGLDPYFGLLSLAEKYGIVKKVGNKYEFPDGRKEFEKAINNNAEEFFTEDMLNTLEECASKEFKYGQVTDD